MADYNTLKESIQEAIKTNGNEEITGAIMQQSLLAMINSLGAGFQFAGVAAESTNPGTPDQNVFYIAGPGTYPNFNNTTIDPQYMGIFCYNQNGWTYSIFQSSTVGFRRSSDGIVQLYDGETPIFPITKTAAVNTANNTVLENIVKALDLSNATAAKGYLFRGIAVSSTNPGTPEQPVFYIAGAGEYTHFGNATLTIAPGNIGIIKYDGSWSLETVQVGAADAVKYTEQTLFDEQKQQARTNIGAASKQDADWLNNGRNIVSLGFTDGYRIASNGVYIAAAGSDTRYKATQGFYDCREQSLLLLRIRLNTYTFIAFYDENNTSISTFGVAAQESGITDHAIPVPKAAKYFRVSGFFDGVSPSDVVCQLVSFGNGIYDMLMGENYRMNAPNDGDITYNADHVAESYPVIWADGTAGIFTASVWYSPAKMYTKYEVTYGSYCKVVQPPITMNSADFTIKRQPKLTIELL